MLKWLSKFFAKRQHRVIACTKSRSIEVQVSPTVKISRRDIQVAFHEARIIRDSGHA